VNHTTETIATLDTSLAPLRYRRHRRTCWVGRHEGQRPMGPVADVMLHEDLEDRLKDADGSGAATSRDSERTVRTNAPRRRSRAAREMACE
jgi:hypothetical protein